MITKGRLKANGGWLLTHAIYEVFVLLALCSGVLLILCAYGDFELRDSEHFRAQAALVAVIPAVCAFSVFRGIVGRWTAAVTVTVFIAILASGYKKKLALSGSILTWNDVATFKNFRIAIAYLSALDWFLTIGVILVLAVLWVCEFSRFKKRQLIRLPLFVMLAAPLAMIAFYPYLANAKIDSMVAKAEISYMSWDWPGNVKRNGLLIHLVQTSLRPVPMSPTQPELRMLAQLPIAPAPMKVPQHIFYILCESCWNDAKHFSDVFKPLEARGLYPMRAISPAYGGGTVNATFEMLTGLPAQGALIGIIFQEYGRIFSDDARTVVSSMKDQGYQTIALHNYYGDFWQRNVVMPKLGFEKFVSLEQMRYKGAEKFPSDSLLFDNTISLLRQHLDDKVFFNLETVYMHGPYNSAHDAGEKSYSERLEKTVQDLSLFVGQLDQLTKNSLVVIYGDHKPSLNRYFFENGVIEEAEFAHTGPTDNDFVFSSEVDMKKLGDVPVLVGFVGREKPDGAQVRALVEKANHKPFYCLGAEISYNLLPTDDPASSFMVSRVCPYYETDTYHGNRARVPPWLYSANLFDVEKPKH